MSAVRFMASVSVADIKGGGVISAPAVPVTDGEPTLIARVSGWRCRRVLLISSSTIAQYLLRQPLGDQPLKERSDWVVEVIQDSEKLLGIELRHFTRRSPEAIDVHKEKWTGRRSSPLEIARRIYGVSLAWSGPQHEVHVWPIAEHGRALPVGCAEAEARPDQQRAEECGIYPRLPRCGSISVLWNPQFINVPKAETLHAIDRGDGLSGLEDQGGKVSESLIALIAGGLDDRG